MAVVTPITITGTLTDAAGVPVAGRVSFSGAPLLRHGASGDVVDPGSPAATAAADGEMTLQVPASDDPAFSPSGWPWHVRLQVGDIRLSFLAAVPHDAPGGVLDLADLVPIVPDGDATLYATAAALAALADDVASGLANLSSDLTTVENDVDAVAATAAAAVPRTLIDANFKIMKASLAAAIQFRATGEKIDIDVYGEPIWSAFSNPALTEGQFGLVRMRGNGLSLGGTLELGATSVYANDSSIQPGIGATLGGLGDLVPGRFVGVKTSTGAPTTGTHQLRDWMIDSAGAVHLCTAAGTPGTWT